MPVRVALVTPLELSRVAEMPLIGVAELGFLKNATEAIRRLVLVVRVLLIVKEACWDVKEHELKVIPIVVYNNSHDDDDEEVDLHLSTQRWLKYPKHP